MENIVVEIYEYTHATNQLYITMNYFNQFKPLFPLTSPRDMLCFNEQKMMLKAIIWYDVNHTMTLVIATQT
jgi:hypothetical protein